MAKRFQLPQGSWLLAEELLEKGDSAFLKELCRIHDADKLGSFAKSWYADRRPNSRALLLQYLELPFATYRHEALVKRLFKLAEAAKDDEAMGRFMVGFDRSVRRLRKKRQRYDWQTRDSWTEETIFIPSQTEMPRRYNPFHYVHPETGEPMAAKTPEKHARIQLFSIRTRKYLRRRAWRYFRTLGKLDPSKYIQAMLSALTLYTDEDCRDGLALLDNWSLMHVLFQHSDVVNAKSRSGWRLSDNKVLSELKPAPAFENGWIADPQPLLRLLSEARSRPVRQWVIAMLKQHHPNAMSNLPIETLVKWIGHSDGEMAQMAVDSLKQATNLSKISAAGWLRLIESANPQVLESVCELVSQQLQPEKLTLDEVVNLACARPIPVARMGLKWLEGRTLGSVVDCQTLLRVVEAESDSVRGQLVQLARRKLETSSFAGQAWVLELLDCRHRDVRDLGWNWFTESPEFCQDVSLWQRLLETPYDDIQLRMVALLGQESSGANSPQTVQKIIQQKDLDPKLLRLLWASTLLNVYRGGKRKPNVVRAVANRLSNHPNEAKELLPLLAVAIRSTRSVEFQIGLTSVVQLLEDQPKLTDQVEQWFPELKMDDMVV